MDDAALVRPRQRIGQGADRQPSFVGQHHRSPIRRQREKMHARVRRQWQRESPYWLRRIGRWPERDDADDAKCNRERPGNTPARLSTALPRACSGAMYAAVPRITPAAVMAGEVSVGDIVRSGWTLDLDRPARAVMKAVRRRGLQTADRSRSFRTTSGR
jgi:hypothetical protein